MRLTIPHYYDFGEDRPEVGDTLASPDAWDGLRTRTEGPFAMAASPESWAAQAESHAGMESRAAGIAGSWRDLGAASLASYGVGGAVLEYWLRKVAPELDLTVTEFAPETIARLEAFFPDATVRHHDLLHDGPVPADVHLFHRIDTEFSNRELKGILKRFRAATLIVVATQVIGWREFVNEFRQRRNPHASRAGVSRSIGVFEALWRRTHVAAPVTYGDLHGWVLTPREGSVGA